jgi:hypothetical protein
MNVKILVAIIISAIIVVVLLYYFFFKPNTGVQDVVSLLDLPITEGQILSRESKAESDNSVTLTLTIGHKLSVDKSSPFDVAQPEGSRLHTDLTALIKEYNMSIEEATVRIYFVEHMIQEGLFTKVYTSRPIYIITGNSNNTLIYTNIPEGVVLPRDYRPQQS